MPLYEYYCEKCDKVFEALRPVAQSDSPAPCPDCGAQADRILPTTFASMSRRRGVRERVPFHHAPVRTEDGKRTVARVKPKDKPKRKKQAGKG
jgi:putative FmdB family regulatory protein